MASVLGTRVALQQSGRILARQLPKRAQHHVRGHLTPRTRTYATLDSRDFMRVSPSLRVEEESLPGYKAENYYPVHIGQVFKKRYKTIGKLGFGASSTVWLCRDLTSKSNEYVALKVYINQRKVHRELPIYSHINTLRSEHSGRAHVRKLFDSFEIEGPYGSHICLVHEPLGRSLAEIADSKADGVLSADSVRELFRWVLRGLEYLHREANVVHTDLQGNNMLFGITDKSIFKTFERNERENPSPRKVLSERTIYHSRKMPFSPGLPALTDLSEARFGQSKNSDDIMPDIYRSPEVILGMPWSYPVDVWALGMVIWDLFQGKRLFPSRNAQGGYSEAAHLAKMVAIMGPPPRDFLARSPKSQKFWDRNGNWKGAVPIPDIDLEMSELRLEGNDKKHFLTFMRKMLQWKPENRASCHDLFLDQWLLADLIRAGKIVLPSETLAPEETLYKDQVDSFFHEQPRLAIAAL